MEVFGIRFAPLRVPWRQRIQTLAACGWFITLGLGPTISLLLTVYLLTCSQFWWVMVAYLTWLWFDRDIANKGGRRSNWVRNWKWWEYFRDYFPLRLVRTVELDPSRNYLFCVFPHGILSTGAFGSFGCEAGRFSEMFPGLCPYVITLAGHFVTPFIREFCLALGGCSSSERSISYLLSAPGGGRAVVLIVGGASESLKCKPGSYRVILKRRKGFVRLALQHGTPLVPVFSFGETDLYDQMEGSWLRWFQETFRKITGIAPVVPIGRGFFQYSFGIIPRRHPVTTVVGSPIEVRRIPEPTEEDIASLHQTFTEALIDLFETHKAQYLKNSESLQLIIE